MDDWVVLTKTRRQLRRAVRITNKTLSALKLAKHPDKTFVGLIKKGFDFLGYYFSAKGVQAAQSTLNKFREKMTRLYEQGASEQRTGDYARQFLRWLVAGVPELGHRLHVDELSISTYPDSRGLLRR